MRGNRSVRQLSLSGGFRAIFFGEGNAQFILRLPDVRDAQERKMPREPSAGVPHHDAVPYQSYPENETGKEEPRQFGDLISPRGSRPALFGSGFARGDDPEVRMISHHAIKTDGLLERNCTAPRFYPSLPTQALNRLVFGITSKVVSGPVRVETQTGVLPEWSEPIRIALNSHRSESIVFRRWSVDSPGAGMCISDRASRILRFTSEHPMSLGKQAKTLSPSQVELLLQSVRRRRHASRNAVICLLSARADLRAHEIANLTWSMLSDASGSIGADIRLEDKASKGRSGRIIPMNRELREALLRWRAGQNPVSEHVISTERSPRTTAQAVVNMFFQWYSDLRFVGCSSHSGRRTFITNAARKISSVGGSLRDVQMLAGHSDLRITQRYIDGEVEAQRRVVELV